MIEETSLMPPLLSLFSLISNCCLICTAVKPTVLMPKRVETHRSYKPTYWLEILKTAFCISWFLKSKHMQSTSLRSFNLIFLTSFPISWRTVSENHFSRNISNINKPTGFYRKCAFFGVEHEDLKFWYLLVTSPMQISWRSWHTILPSSISKVTTTSARKHYRDCKRIMFWAINKQTNR